MKKMRSESTSRKAFSLAEALITLLIVCLITIATIPILTKKKRTMKEVKHGAFACYWVGDKLVSKYYTDGRGYDGSTVFDAAENRDGCVFNPPPESKNFVVTLVGGGGGGAMGAIKNGFAFYTETVSSFQIPSNGFYEFLVLGAGGGGGAVDGSCGNATTWPCGVTGSPGGLLVTNKIELKKDDVINLTAGKSGRAHGSDGDHHGEHGDDSQVTGPNNLSLFAQGGGGGAAVDYNGQNECRFYKNNYLRSTLIYDRPYDSHDCSSKGTARDVLGKSGNPGGYSYSGPGSIYRTASVGSKGAWYEYEKSGAYYYDNDWNKKAQATKNSNSKRRPNRNPGMTKVLMDEFAVSKYEDQSLPFGSGGCGEGGGVGNARWGGRGVVAIKWKQQYGALGGKAGSVLQIPFAELPQKTLAFPGNGGRGSYSYEKALSPFSQHTITLVEPAAAGVSTYLKNYPEVTGGAGATRINMDDSATYYSSISGGDIIGANGELANINPTKKPEGGAGGFSKIGDNGYIDNNSAHGGTRPIFSDGSEIALFNKLVGAGAGGGGGSATSDLKGLGGAGSSGIVFIQW